MLARFIINSVRTIRTPSRRVGENLGRKNEENKNFIALSEKEIQKLKERDQMHNYMNQELTPVGDVVSIDKTNVEEQINEKPFMQKKEKKKKLKDMVLNHPLIEPIMPENQYERLKEAVIPLHKFPYKKQLQIKQKHAEDILKELRVKLKEVEAPVNSLWNRLPCPLESVVPSPDLMNYRNKDEFSVHLGVDDDPKTVGYFIGLPTDPLMRCVPPTPLFNIRESHKMVVKHFQNFIRDSPYKTCFNFKEGGVWRNIIVRSNLKGELMAVITIYPDLSPEDIEKLKFNLRDYFFNGLGSECCLTSLYFQACSHSKCTREMAPFELIEGEPYLTETCLNHNFQISPDTFFQTNTRSAELLYESIIKVAELSSFSTLLDICCGTGIISILLAPKCRSAIGIDALSASIEDAKFNAKNNNVRNTSYICGKIEKVLPVLSTELESSSDVVAILNPARSGVHPSVVKTIRECESIKKLIFVTCKPEGNAMKNMAMLCSTLNPSHWRWGRKKVDEWPKNKDRITDPFSLRYAIPIDLFPHTAHLEFVFLFERISEE